tara:strand:+ start:1699 stop:1911 length:213 start_codon:yes stop_codon:yes gene_type:complete
MNEETVIRTFRQEVTLVVETTKDGGFCEYSLQDLINDPDYFAEGLQKGWIEMSVEAPNGTAIKIDEREAE